MLLSTSSSRLLHKEPILLVLGRDGSITALHNDEPILKSKENLLPPHVHFLPLTTSSGGGAGEFAIVGYFDVPVIVHCSARELIGLSALLQALQTNAREWHISRLTDSNLSPEVEQEKALSGSFLVRGVAPAWELEAPSSYFEFESTRLLSLHAFFSSHASVLHEEAFEILALLDVDLLCLRLAQLGFYYNPTRSPAVLAEAQLFHLWSGLVFSSRDNVDFKHLLTNAEVELERFGWLSNLENETSNIPLALSCANQVLWECPRRAKPQGPNGSIITSVCAITNAVCVAPRTREGGGGLCKLYLPHPQSHSRMQPWFSFSIANQGNSSAMPAFSQIMDVAISAGVGVTSFEMELNRRGEKCIIESAAREGDLVFLIPQEEDEGKRLGRLGRVISRPSSSVYLVQPGSAPLLDRNAVDRSAAHWNVASSSSNTAALNLPVYHPSSHVLPVTEKRILDDDYHYIIAVVLTELGAAVYEREWETEAWRMRSVAFWEMRALQHVWFYTPRDCLLAARGGKIYLWRNVPGCLAQPPQAPWLEFATSGGTSSDVMLFAKSEQYVALCDGTTLKLFDIASMSPTPLVEQVFDTAATAILIEQDLKVRVLLENGQFILVDIPASLCCMREESQVISLARLLDSMTWTPIQFAARFDRGEWFESSASGEMQLWHCGVWDFAPTLVSSKAGRYSVFGQVEFALIGMGSRLEMEFRGEKMELVVSSRFDLHEGVAALNQVSITALAGTVLVRFRGRSCDEDESALRAQMTNLDPNSALGPFALIWATVTGGGQDSKEERLAALALLRNLVDKSPQLLLQNGKLVEFIHHQFVLASDGLCLKQALALVQNLPLQRDVFKAALQLCLDESMLCETKQGLAALLNVLDSSFSLLQHGGDREEYSRDLVSLLQRTTELLMNAPNTRTWQSKVLREFIACGFDPFVDGLRSMVAEVEADGGEEEDLELSNTQSISSKKKLVIRVHSFSPGSTTMFRKTADTADQQQGARSVEICFHDVLKLNTTHAVVWDLTLMRNLLSMDVSIALSAEEDASASLLGGAGNTAAVAAACAQKRFACTVEAFVNSPATWSGEKLAYAARDEQGVPFDIDLFAASGSFSFDKQSGVIGMKSTFPTIAPRGVAMQTGRYYYEVTVYNTSEGVAQVGFCDAQYVVDDKGANGCGDCEHSWAFDGNRVKRWNKASTSWGRKWSDGDVIGCAIDIDEGNVLFSLNGSWKRPMGLAFSRAKIARGVFPAVTGERAFKCKMNFGQTPFAHAPPPPSPSQPGAQPFKSVFDWILAHRAAAAAAAGEGESVTLWTRKTFSGPSALISCRNTLAPAIRAKYLRISFTSLPQGLKQDLEEENKSRKRVVAKLTVKMVGRTAAAASATATPLYATEEEVQRLEERVLQARCELNVALEEFASYNSALPESRRWTLSNTLRLSKKMAEMAVENGLLLPNIYMMRILDVIERIAALQQQQQQLGNRARGERIGEWCDQWRDMIRFACNALLRVSLPQHVLGLDLLFGWYENLCVDQVAFNRPVAGQLLKHLLEQCSAEHAIALLLRLARSKSRDGRVQQQDARNELLNIVLPPSHVLESEPVWQLLVPELLLSRELVPFCCAVIARLQSSNGNGARAFAFDTARAVDHVLAMLPPHAREDVLMSQLLECLLYLRSVSNKREEEFLRDLCADARFVECIQRLTSRHVTSLEGALALKLLNGSNCKGLRALLPNLPQIPLELERNYFNDDDALVRLAQQVFAGEIDSIYAAKEWALVLRQLTGSCADATDREALLEQGLTKCLGVLDAALVTIFAADLLAWLTRVGMRRQVLQVLCTGANWRFNPALYVRVLELYFDPSVVDFEFADLILPFMEQTCSVALHRDEQRAKLLFCLGFLELRPTATLLVERLSLGAYQACLEWYCKAQTDGERQLVARLHRFFKLACNTKTMGRALIRAFSQQQHGACKERDALFQLALNLARYHHSEDMAAFVCNELLTAAADGSEFAPRTEASSIPLRFTMGDAQFPLHVRAARNDVTRIALELTRPAILSRLQVSCLGEVMLRVYAGMDKQTLVPCTKEELGVVHCTRSKTLFDLSALPCAHLLIEFWKTTTQCPSALTREEDDAWFLPGDCVCLAGQGSETGTVVAFDGEFAQVKWQRRGGHDELSQHAKSSLVRFVAAAAAENSLDNGAGAEQHQLLDLKIFGQALPVAAAAVRRVGGGKLEELTIALLLAYVDRFPQTVAALRLVTGREEKANVLFPVNTKTKRELATSLAKLDLGFAQRAMEDCLVHMANPQCLALALKLATLSPQNCNAFHIKARGELASYLRADSPPKLPFIWLMRVWALVWECGGDSNVVAALEDFDQVWQALDRCGRGTALERALTQLLCTMLRSSRSATTTAAVEANLFQHALGLAPAFPHYKFTVLAISCAEMLGALLPNMDAYFVQTGNSGLTAHVLDELITIALERNGAGICNWLRESGTLTRCLQALSTSSAVNGLALKAKLLHLLELACNQNAANQALVAEYLAASCDVDVLAMSAQFENLVQVQVWDLHEEVERLAARLPNMEEEEENGPEKEDGGFSLAAQDGSWFKLNPAARGKTVDLPVAGNLLVATQMGSEKWGTVRADRELPRTGQCVWEVRLDQSPKGHVFLGVATEATNLDGYIGGDKYSYGFIGNRGLWHKRHKEASYGKEFKTGDVIRVIFDASEGTLAYCLNGESLGVAFTGLKDEHFFPAFSLYQKGDKITILSSTYIPAPSTSAAASVLPPSTSSNFTASRLSALNGAVNTLEEAEKEGVVSLAHAWQGAYFVQGDEVSLAQAVRGIAREARLRHGSKFELDFVSIPEDFSDASNSSKTMALSQLISALGWEDNALHCRIVML